MRIVTLRIISKNKISIEDKLFEVESNYSYKNLNKWIERNCKGSSIINEKDKILSYYKDRIEIYCIRDII